MPAETRAQTDVDTLEQLNRDYIASIQTSDVRRFDQILAEEFYCSNPDGSLVDRAAFLLQTAPRHALLSLRRGEIEDMAHIYVIHENDAWVEPLREALGELRAAVRGVVPERGASSTCRDAARRRLLQPDERLVAHPRPSLRGRITRACVLAWLAAHGRRVVNDAGALEPRDQQDRPVRRAANAAGIRRRAPCGGRAGADRRRGAPVRRPVDPQAQPRRQGARACSCSTPPTRSTPTSTAPTTRRRSTASPPAGIHPRAGAPHHPRRVHRRRVSLRRRGRHRRRVRIVPGRRVRGRRRVLPGRPRGDAPRRFTIIATSTSASSASAASSPPTASRSPASSSSATRGHRLHLRRQHQHQLQRGRGGSGSTA